MAQSLRIDQLPIDKDILNMKITKDDLHKPIFRNYFLIELALLCGEMKIIEQSLKLDQCTYKNVRQQILIDMIYVFKHDDIIKFLNLLDDAGQAFILSPDTNWCLPIFFNTCTNKQTEQMIKFKINYGILLSNGHTILGSYLDKVKIESNVDQILLKKILISSKPLIENHIANISPIVDNMYPFNEQMLDTFLEIYPNGLTMFTYRFWDPLTISISTNNIEFFDFVIKYIKKTKKPIYNKFGITSPIIVAIQRGNNYVLQTLLSFPKIDVNIHDKYHNLPAHIMLKCESISLENKRNILEKTENINLQNLNGNTVLHSICSHNMLLEFVDILEKKLCDVFIKNNIGVSPIHVCNDLSTLLYVTAKGFINNSHKTQVNSVCLPKLKDNKKISYDQIHKCISVQVNKELDGKNTSNKYKIDTRNNRTDMKFITEKYTEYNIFQSSTTDAYIYLLYFVQKYKLKLLTFQDMIINDKSEATRSERELINKFPIFKGVDMFWYNNNDHIILGNFSKILKSLKSGVYFIYLTLFSSNESYHQNGIIIDVKKKIVLRFEPHGSISDHRQITFDKMFNKLCKKGGYEYLPASKFMAENSFQTLADETNFAFLRVGDLGGYCLAWTLWFLEFYIININKDVKLLTPYAIEQIINSGQTFKEYIRSYANKLANYKIKFLRSIKYPAKKIFNIYYSDDDINMIFDKINKKYINVN